MGKQVKVRFLGNTNKGSARVTRDCTVGKVYAAIILAKGDRCHEGFLVDVDDGIQVLEDDAGDTVSTALQCGWEIVEE